MAEKFNLSVILKFISDDKGIKGFKKNMKSLGASMKNIGREMTTKVSLPIVAFGGLALKSAIDMETAFTGVLKTVNGTTQELSDLKEQIKAMSQTIPLTTTELFGVAEAAGQLGIETKNIAGFTKVMADLGVTTNLASEEAASSLAKFANITGLSQTKFDRLGSTIVDLGNKTATTEKDIVAMALRLAGAGKTVGLTDAQILAFAASLSSVGVEAEAGGSAFSQVFKRIDKEIDSGSEKMDNFALVAGKSTADFERAWKEDAGSALLDFVGGLDEAGKAGINVNQILDKLGLEGIRISDSLLRAAGANEKFRANQKIANTAWKENTALQKESALRYATTKSELLKFKNEMDLLSESFGKIMVPGLRNVLKELKPFIKGLKELSPEMKENILKIAGLFAVGGPILVGLGVLTAALGAITAPVAIAVAVLAGIGLLAAIIMKNWEPIKQFFNDMLGGIKQFFNDMLGGIGAEWDQFVSKWNAEWKRVWEAIPKPIRDFITGTNVDVDLNAPGVDLDKQGSLGQAAKAFIPESLRGNKSTSEVIIKVTSEKGASAVVAGVKQTGETNLKVQNKSDVGLTMDNMGFAIPGVSP